MITQEKTYSHSDVENLPWEVLAPTVERENVRVNGARKLRHLIKGGLCRNLERTQAEIENIILGTNLVRDKEDAISLFNYLTQHPLYYKSVRGYKEMIPVGFELESRKREDGRYVYWVSNEYII